MTLMIRVKKRKKKLKTIMITILSLIIVSTFVLGGLMLYGKYQISKIPDLTFNECLQYTTKNNGNAIITVGYIKDGEITYKVFGENGKELGAEETYTYEIGSITKTFTAALINKAINEGKVNIDSTIDIYLDLPNGNEYPTIKELLTHTSGYRGYYFETPMISNFFAGRNDFFGVTEEMVFKKAGSLDMNKEEYAFCYSNYGYAVLGLVLEEVYQQEYTALVNAYCQDELGLSNTRISDKNGNLSNYWDWEADDAYLSAGGITSNIFDMLSYAQMQLDSNSDFYECHNSQKTINASTKDYETMGINMDEIGMSWIIDKENNIIWHNGGTGDYNSYIGFNVETKTAVVVLSNLAPNYRIPATVLGVKLLSELDN